MMSKYNVSEIKEIIVNVIKLIRFILLLISSLKSSFPEKESGDEIKAGNHTS